DPGLRSSVYPDVCPDIRVRPYTRTTPEVCPSLSGAGGVEAIQSRSGAADDATGGIADPGLRSSVHPDVCCGIRVGSRTPNTSRIYSNLRGTGRVADQDALAHRCAGDGTARWSSRHLRLTEWYCRNADRNQSKFNRCNLSHIISLHPTSSLVRATNLSY